MQTDRLVSVIIETLALHDLMKVMVKLEVFAENKFTKMVEMSEVCKLHTLLESRLSLEN